MRSEEREVWGRWASAKDRSVGPLARPTLPSGRNEKVVTDYSNTPRDATRVPLAHRIQLKFDRFSGFINEYLSNISPGGIFIRTDSPELPGQLLDFEFRLGDGYELIHGRGEVVWARQRADGPERPPGMGVRFLELSPGSKDLIYKIVDDYVAHGGKPFDLTPPAPPAGAPEETPAAGGAPAWTPGELPAGTQDERPAPAPARPPAEAPYNSADELGAGAPGGWPAEPPAGPRSAAPALPWTLDLPPIQPLPGVPAITPRSPLESLGAGGAFAPFEPAARAEAGAPGAAGRAVDPLAQMAAAPQRAPAFSAFDSRVPVRRSRLPLIAALVAVGLLALAVFLARDYLLGWLERREQAHAERSPVPPQSAPSRPAVIHRAATPTPLTRPSSPSPAAAPAAAGQAAVAPAAAAQPSASSASAAPAAGPPPLVTARTPPGAAPASAPAQRVTAVERITWEASPGATDVVLWGNGDFAPQSYTRSRVTGAPVREVVRITGITRPFPSPRLAVSTPELLQVRTGFHPPQELHVVLDLGGRGVEVAAVEAGPRQLRIRLRSK